MDSMRTDSGRSCLTKKARSGKKKMYFTGAEAMVETTLLSASTLDLLWTLALIAVLFAAGAYALVLIPWSDREINRVHNAALALLFPQLRPRALARVRR